MYQLRLIARKSETREGKNLLRERQLETADNNDWRRKQGLQPWLSLAWCRRGPSTSDRRGEIHGGSAGDTLHHKTGNPCKTT